MQHEPICNRRQLLCMPMFFWLKALPGSPVFVGYPAAYDFLFVYWYLMRFVGESPFSHSALDIKTFAMALTGKTYRGQTRHAQALDSQIPAHPRSTR
jgi:hypothetical protein